MKVFISYAMEDFETAKKLSYDLKNAGLAPWIDKENILPGQNWMLEIKQAIKASSYFLLLLSSNSISKEGYIQKEQKIVLDMLDDFLTSDIFIIPIRLDDCNPIDENIQHIKWVDLFSSYESGFKQILRVLSPEIGKDEHLLKQLADRHTKLRKELKKVGHEAGLAKTEKLLSEMISAGKYISDPEQRSILTDLTRDLGEIIYEAFGEYPSVMPDPPEYSTNIEYLTEQNNLARYFCEYSTNKDDFKKKNKRATITPALCGIINEATRRFITIMWDQHIQPLLNEEELKIYEHVLNSIEIVTGYNGNRKQGFEIFYSFLTTFNEELKSLKKELLKAAFDEYWNFGTMGNYYWENGKIDHTKRIPYHKALKLWEDKNENSINYCRKVLESWFENK